jgi:NADH-quinone oxidoreductase subunit H
MTPELKGFLFLSIIKMIVVFTVIMVGVALLTLMERKVSAWMQNRRGPNRVGWAGLLQPAADGVKNILKEETYPALANRWLFVLAPAMSFVPALLLSAVIPFAAPVPMNFDVTVRFSFFGLFPIDLGRWANHGLMPLVVADLPIGFLFVLAISSMGVYGIALAGWSSNSKYALLGGLRATAQMISYEVAMGLSLIPVLLMSGNVSFAAIIADQQAGLWYVLPLFLSFFIFLVSGFAETNRLPFDLPEAESELIAGYYTEYSAMKMGLFMFAEFIEIAIIGALFTTLFLGGYNLPFMTDEGFVLPGNHVVPISHAAIVVIQLVVFLVKMLLMSSFQILVRWTLPRFRWDQLLRFAWKFMFPLALANLTVTAVVVWALQA